MRFIILLALTVVLLLTLSACESESDASTDQASLATEDSTPLDIATEVQTDELTEKPASVPTDKSTEAPRDDGAPEVLRKHTYNVLSDWENFKYVGRTGVAEDGITCDFTASGIEFVGRMVGDVILTLYCDRETYFTVFIDGERVEERLSATNETAYLVLASFEELGEHHIRVLKQSEPQSSLCVLNTVVVKGELDKAPAKKDSLIEFIGDSITCGFGVLADPTSPNPGSVFWEDGTQTYAFFAAESLGADATVIGCSGIGIVKGGPAFTEKEFYLAASYCRDPEIAYYSKLNVPDVVVINLGTNDEVFKSTEADFKAGVRELINTVRSFYDTNIPIVWAYNMMGNGCFDWTRSVLEDMGGEKAGLYSVKLIQNGSGGAGHPDIPSHIIAGDQLATFIEEKELLKK